MERNFAMTLSHVAWIGGSPCSGKSSIAAALAEQFEMTIYSCDDAWERHRTMIDAARFPVFHRLSSASCDELWMRPVDTQVSEEIDVYREEFPLILDDLLALPSDRPVLAEGAALMPHLVHGLHIPPDRTMWLVPTPAFQREHYARRDWRHGVLAGCSDREQAWRNWMSRDIGFARFVSDEARLLDRTCITVDGSQSIEAVFDEVRVRLDFAPSP